MVVKDMTYATPSKRTEEVLLMTYRVKVMAPDGSVTQARALLDSSASTCLITERLAKKLRLSRCLSNLKIHWVAGFNVRPRGNISFKVAGVRGGGSRLRSKPPSFSRSLMTYQQFVLPLLPSGSTCWTWSLQTRFYGIPAGVNILLGWKVFSKAVLHGQRFSPAGAPSAFKWWGEWQESTVLDSHLWCCPQQL